MEKVLSSFLLHIYLLHKEYRGLPRRTKILTTPWPAQTSHTKTVITGQT